MTSTAALPGLQGRLAAFSAALRRAGVPAGLSDGLDAQRAMAAVDLLDRGVLREALAATLISSAGQRVAFDQLFDVYFPRTMDAGPEVADPDTAPPEGEPDVDSFVEELMRAVREGDEATLRRLAAQAVGGWGGVGNPDGSRSYFGYRVWRNVQLGGVLRRMLDEDANADALEDRLARDAYELALERFRQAVDAELRRRQAEARGPDEVARRNVRPLPEDVDFFSVTAAEQAAMRSAVRPLARKLAARLALRRKRARDGTLDVRRTLRRALATGGVPVDPAFRSRHPRRPDLVLLCDVSSSVAAFAKFTLLFCHALQGQFSRVRSFAFIDTVDEVTGLFASGDPGIAMSRLATEADLVWLDGHSDYGHALEVFATRWRDAVGPRTTLLILGDARNNYRAGNTWALKELVGRARKTYWLNPEPRASWDSGDSIASDYAAVVDRMAECRTLRQLAGFVEGLGVSG